MLRKAWKESRLSHAYLFSGNDDLLQEFYALSLARLVVCENPANAPCEECPACKSVARNTHCDARVLETDFAIKDLKSSMSTRPWTSPMRIAIVKRAHEMSVAAQSALLKLLEDPPGRSLFVLCTSAPGSLLDTVRSRTQEIRWYSFSSVTPSEESRATFKTISEAPLHERLRLAKKLSDDPEETLRLVRDILRTARESMIGAAIEGRREETSRVKALVERLQEGARRLEETNASPLLVLEQIALSVS